MEMALVQSARACWRSKKDNGCKALGLACLHLSLLLQVKPSHLPLLPWARAAPAGLLEKNSSAVLDVWGCYSPHVLCGTFFSYVASLVKVGQCNAGHQRDSHGIYPLTQGWLPGLATHAESQWALHLVYCSAPAIPKSFFF